jgi:hypothetical protein
MLTRHNPAINECIASSLNNACWFFSLRFEKVWVFPLSTVLGASMVDAHFREHSRNIRRGAIFHGRSARNSQKQLYN